MKKEAEVATARKIDLHQLHQATHQRINNAVQKTNLSEREVYLIAKEFFKNLLELNYEFTHDELIEELRKTYLDKNSFTKLENFILVLGQMEYGKKKFSQEELKVILEEMKDIVDQLIKHHHKKISFLDKILMILNPNKKNNFEYETSALQELEKEIVAEEEVVDLELIESLRKLIREAVAQKDKEKAKAIYLESKKMYETLGNAEKKHIYPELLAAAEKIKKFTQEQTNNAVASNTKQSTTKSEDDLSKQETTKSTTQKDADESTEKEKPSEESKTSVEEKEEQKPSEDKLLEDKSEQEESTSKELIEEPKEEETVISDNSLFEEQEEPVKSAVNESEWTVDHEEILPEKKEESSFVQEIIGENDEPVNKSEQDPVDINELIAPPEKEKKKTIKTKPVKKSVSRKKSAVKKSSKKSTKKKTPKKVTTK